MDNQMEFPESMSGVELKEFLSSMPDLDYETFQKLYEEYYYIGNPTEEEREILELLLHYNEEIERYWRNVEMSVGTGEKIIGHSASDRRKTTDFVFDKVDEQETFTLRNQDEETEQVNEIEIQDFIDIMFEDPDQFVTLAAPKAIAGIYFVQAVRVGDGIEVELGVEYNQGTKLYYKLCSKDECEDIFMLFYRGNYEPDMQEFQPVEIMQR